MGVLPGRSLGTGERRRDVTAAPILLVAFAVLAVLVARHEAKSPEWQAHLRREQLRRLAADFNRAAIIIGRALRPAIDNLVVAINRLARALQVNGDETT